ncbi:MAG: hypothetical protein DRJ52_08180 [Thermoprotei archaeon]|nr:MAG: hypothetical protein DRJ52_08180 [Thermoprotei archaeon]
MIFPFKSNISTRKLIERLNRSHVASFKKKFIDFFDEIFSKRLSLKFYKVSSSVVGRDLKRFNIVDCYLLFLGKGGYGGLCLCYRWDRDLSDDLLIERLGLLRDLISRVFNDICEKLFNDRCFLLPYPGFLVWFKPEEFGDRDCGRLLFLSHVGFDKSFSERFLVDVCPFNDTEVYASERVVVMVGGDYRVFEVLLAMVCFIYVFDAMLVDLDKRLLWAFERGDYRGVRRLWSLLGGYVLSVRYSRRMFSEVYDYVIGGLLDRLEVDRSLSIVSERLRFVGEYLAEAAGRSIEVAVLVLSLFTLIPSLVEFFFNVLRFPVFWAFVFSVVVSVFLLPFVLYVCRRVAYWWLRKD